MKTVLRIHSGYRSLCHPLMDWLTLQMVLKIPLRNLEWWYWSLMLRNPQSSLTSQFWSASLRSCLAVSGLHQFLIQILQEITRSAGFRSSLLIPEGILLYLNNNCYIHILRWSSARLPYKVLCSSNEINSRMNLEYRRQISYVTSFFDLTSFLGYILFSDSLF